MGRYKTPHRLQIEDFLADTDETRDDWLMMPCKTTSDKNKYYCTAYQLKAHGYPIAIVEYDPINKSVNIRRSN